MEKRSFQSSHSVPPPPSQSSMSSSTISSSTLTSSNAMPTTDKPKAKRTRRTFNPTTTRGPDGRSSIYRGVTRHKLTGRYEAHLWDKNCWIPIQNKKGRQIYLGAYDDEEQAAHTYDLAAIKYWGPTAVLNFPASTYVEEFEDMQIMTTDEYVVKLRRKSSGFSRGLSKYRGVVRHNGRWEARFGRVLNHKYLYLGTFNTQEEAAQAYDRAALTYRGPNAVTNFDRRLYVNFPQFPSSSSSSPPPLLMPTMPPPVSLIQSLHQSFAQPLFQAPHFPSQFLQPQLLVNQHPLLQHHPQPQQLLQPLQSSQLQPQHFQPQPQYQQALSQKQSSLQQQPLNLTTEILSKEPLLQVSLNEASGTVTSILASDCIGDQPWSPWQEASFDEFPLEKLIDFSDLDIDEFNNFESLFEMTEFTGEGKSGSSNDDINSGIVDVIIDDDHRNGTGPGHTIEGGNVKENEIYDHLNDRYGSPIGHVGPADYLQGELAAENITMTYASQLVMFPPSGTQSESSPRDITSELLR